MEMNIKHRVAAGALALSLFGGSGVGVAAQGNGNQTGGAAGLVAIVAQDVADVTANDVIDVRVIDSFNNLRALNNVLNNSPILSQNNIDIVVQDIDADVLSIEIGDVTVGQILSQNDIDVDAAVGLAILNTGDILVFV